MNRPDPLTPAAQAYLNDVDARLRDLSPADHAELLADVEARLTDLASGPAPTVELGPPADFADELRRAAGFAPAPVLIAERPTTLLDWFAQLPRREPLAGTIDYLRSLRPAWWAVRGYALVALVLVAIKHPEHWGLHTFGHYSDVVNVRAIHADGRWPAWLPPWLMPILAAVVASVVLGRATTRLGPKSRLGVVALNLLAGFALLAWPTWWVGPAFAYFTGIAG